jgi:glucose/arabinose dehydrogenase
VYYTADSPTTHNRISRLTADPANPNQMIAGSEVALVDLPDLVATNHNGGALHFGPDGKLYAAVGNNAVNANSPSLNTVLGKMLRFNPDGTIPADNPLVAVTTGPNQAIWAYGLRNLFNFAFQPGANYGWPTTEGPTSAAGITPPIFAYGHPTLPPGQPASTGTFLRGSAVLGAAFDPAASTWPAAYQGGYYFSDLSGGWVARMDLATGTVSTFATGFGSMRGLAFGIDGALYALSQSEVQRICHPERAAGA